MEGWPLIGIRFALYADLGLLFGLPLFPLYALRSDARRLLPLRPAILALAAAGFALSLAGFAIMAGAMTGTPIGEIDRATWTMLLTRTAAGSALLARLAALAALLLLAIVARRATAPALAAAAALGGIALATLAWSGHAVAGEGIAGMVHLVADIVHLLAAAAWLGALGGLACLVARRNSRESDLRATHRALAGFALVGTLLVGAIVITGMLNAWFMIGPDHLRQVATGRYGQLLIAKLALFAIMLVMAARNRFRLTPALDAVIARGEERSARAALLRSVTIEAGLGLMILALVAWLGTLAPPIGS
ncbi:hypothetical protein GCM10009087_54570 [Sphingomonas oligophenolica]|uniref:Copper homeostasis membrane protein CopD n=1 Tax=Sphingomonas oligophenolica TaxID=301154 RepID=A0ABU9Y531_9SPHN